MSFMPAFKLGLLNAWILTLPLLVLMVFGVKILGKREIGESPDLTNKEKAVFNARHIIFLASCVYCIFLPLKLSTPWFLGGLLVYVLGMLIEALALLSFYKTSVDMLITEGVYSISRHPIYVGFFFIKIGISMSCLSWIFLLLAIISVILENDMVDVEERWCLEKYGDAYREYANRTPKWIGLPKIRKK